MYIYHPLEVKKVIVNSIEPDFKVLTENTNSNILHRKVGVRDLYFVYGVPKGTKCFFRCTGRVELWNPWNGEVKLLKVSSASETGTMIELPLEKNEAQLIVFSPGKPELVEPVATIVSKRDTLMIDTDWEFELKPTLDNKYGDYRLPAFDGKLGVEVWKMKYADEKSIDAGWKDPGFDDSKWATVTVSYGPQFWRLGPILANGESRTLETKLSLLEQIDIDPNGEFRNLKPYEFSWRWGLKDDAGYQGYHGLKGLVNNELISLGMLNRSNRTRPIPVYSMLEEEQGSVYFLWSTVSASRHMQAMINKSGILPVKVYINHIEIPEGQGKVDLKPGANTILLKYNTPGRGYFLLEADHSDKSWKQSTELATNWYLNSSVLQFDYLPQVKERFGWYRFLAPPGARIMIVQSISKPGVWISGIEVQCHQVKETPARFVDTKTPVWEVFFPDTVIYSARIALRIEQKPGFYGGAAIPEPILFECTKGRIQLGDLGENESLKTYSGGMWYRKTITLTAEQVISPNITIDLGNVVASAEVFVNGNSVGSKTSSPWIFDLTGKLQTGENRIELLVYNTLGNHYLTTPSMYVGRINSGLIGPVRLEFCSK